MPWMWLGEAGKFAQSHLWDAFRFAGMTTCCLGKNIIARNNNSMKLPPLPRHQFYFAPSTHHVLILISHIKLDIKLVLRLTSQCLFILTQASMDIQMAMTADLILCDLPMDWMISCTFPGTLSCCRHKR